MFTQTIVIQYFSSFIISAGRTRIAINKEIASSTKVRVVSH
ncbi:MAG: hypothetical protein ACRC2S_15870 [Waterburya sp.]